MAQLKNHEVYEEELWARVIWLFEPRSSFVPLAPRCGVDVVEGGGSYDFRLIGWPLLGGYAVTEVLCMMGGSAFLSN